MRRHLLYYRIWPGVYRRAAKQPIDEKKVLLATNIPDHLPDNLSCMKEEYELICDEYDAINLAIDTLREADTEIQLSLIHI